MLTKNHFLKNLLWKYYYKWEDYRCTVDSKIQLHFPPPRRRHPAYKATF